MMYPCKSDLPRLIIILHPLTGVPAPPDRSARIPIWMLLNPSSTRTAHPKPVSAIQPSGLSCRTTPECLLETWMTHIYNRDATIRVHQTPNAHAQSQDTIRDSISPHHMAIHPGEESSHNNTEERDSPDRSSVYRLNPSVRSSREHPIATSGSSSADNQHTISCVSLQLLLILSTS